MKRILDDLWQTKLEIPFGGVHAHAYFLQKDSSNVLFYNTGHADEIEHMAALGGIEYQYLSHRDETGESLKAIQKRFRSKLCCHREEEAAVTKSCPVDVTFSDDVTQHFGVEVIYTPGHTIGSVSYLYRSPFGRCYLFTGDTLFQSHGEWETFPIVSAGGSPHALISSLRTYRELNPDVVLWSASGGGEMTFAQPSEGEWKTIIDDVVDRLSK